ncbi:MAG: amino acid permease [Spirochaetales bacterium]|nr:amino acid permease [Spirochaetales bacterium]
MLKRDLDLTHATAVGLGAIIGAGIFVVTGIAAGAAGPAFLLALLIAGLAAVCNALSSAELAARYPLSGGTYEYGYQLLGPSLGFSAGWMFLASKLAAGGTVALGLGGYLSELIPGLPPRAVAITVALLLTWANYSGIKKVGRINAFIVAVTILVLLYFILAGIGSFDADNLQPFAPFGLRGVMEAAALFFFAYTGYARIATLGEEVSEPRTTIPRAIILSIGISLFLYIAVCIVATGAVGSVALAGAPSPLARAARGWSWPWVVAVVGLGATTAMVGVLLSQILGISRMMYAMARRGDLPAALGHLNVERGVPDRGIFLTGAVIVALAWFGTIEWVVSAASFTILLYYTLTNLAALRMVVTDKLFPDWIAWLGLILCLLLSFSLKLQTVAFGLGLLGTGHVLRLLFRLDLHRRPDP